MVLFQANGYVGKTNTKSNMFDPCDCSIAEDQEEREIREICPPDRGSWLRQSIVPTQHFQTVRSSGLRTAHGFFGLGIIILHTDAGVSLCFSECKFGVLGRKFRSKEKVLLFAF